MLCLFFLEPVSSYTLFLYFLCQSKFRILINVSCSMILLYEWPDSLGAGDCTKGSILWCIDLF